MDIATQWLFPLRLVIVGLGHMAIPSCNSVRRYGERCPMGSGRACQTGCMQIGTATGRQCSGFSSGSYGGGLVSGCMLGRDGDSL